MVGAEETGFAEGFCVRQTSSSENRKYVSSFCLASSCLAYSVVGVPVSAAP